jgi:hypothetical protein
MMSGEIPSSVVLTQDDLAVGGLELLPLQTTSTQDVGGLRGNFKLLWEVQGWRSINQTLN